jgi:hypothetical protein
MSSQEGGILLYAAGYCFDAGKATQRSGAAVVMVVSDAHGRTARRVVAHPTGGAPKTLCEINAIKLALASVKKKFRKSESVTLVVPKHVGDFVTLEGDKYKKNSKKYEDDLGTARRWAGYYNNLHVAIPDGPTHKEAIAYAKSCADSQKPKDTKTQQVNE